MLSKLADKLMQPTAAERRLREALFAAMLPGDRDAGLPAYADLDLAEFWNHFEHHAPGLLRFGVRASSVLFALEPVLFGFGPRLFTQLTPEERDAFLQKIAERDDVLHRQCVLALKTTICFAYFGEASARNAYDTAPPHAPIVGANP